MSKKIIHHNGKQIEFSNETPPQLIQVILGLIESKKRITLDYGNTKTGESWNEDYGVTGYLSLTTGQIKGVILVYNARSLGGGIILDHCILSIKYANKKNGGYLYKLKIKQED